MNSDAMTGPATGPADARGRVGGSAETASPAAPSLRQLTPPASLLLVAAAGAWAGVVLLARDMGSMPGTMGLGAGSPLAARIHAQARRLPRAHARPAGRALPRHILRGMLLGLMAVLVAFGLMNVIAMVVLAGAVLAEKTWARGTGFSRALGVAALGLAVAVVFEPGLAPGLHYAGAGGMGGM